MATVLHHLATAEDLPSVVAELHRTEAALSSELVALPHAIAQVEAVLRAPPTGGSLLTCWRQRENSVCRERGFFSSSRPGIWKECVMAGLVVYRAGRSSPTSVVWGFYDQGRQ
jgi:hypothetical protein